MTKLKQNPLKNITSPKTAFLWPFFYVSLPFLQPTFEFGVTSLRYFHQILCSSVPHNWFFAMNLSGPCPDFISHMISRMYRILKDGMKLWSSVKNYAVSDSSCTRCIWQVPTCEQNLSKLLLEELYFISVWLINSHQWGRKGLFSDSTSKYISAHNISHKI